MVMFLVTVIPEVHVHAPAGMVTISPFEAAAIAVATSALEHDNAVWVAANAFGDIKYMPRIIAIDKIDFIIIVMMILPRNT